MKLIRLILSVLVLTLSVAAFGQKIKIKSGDLANLKTVNKVSLEYDYSEFAVGKFDKEADYVQDKTADMNEDEAGKGDKWATEWEADKLGKYKPKFEELFTKTSEKISIEEGAEVTMHIKTTFIEPGFNVGVMRRPALVDLTITFKKGEEELVVMTVDDSPGNAAMGYDFDDGLRIGESYAKAGKEVGQYLTKKIK